MTETAWGAPIITRKQTVIEDWIDYNGHLNMAFYNVMFDRGVDDVYDMLGVGESYVANGGSVFTMEVHLHYVQELSLGAPVRVHFQLLDYDAKRLHFFEEMYHEEEGFLAATSEQIAMNVSMTTRRSAPFDAHALEKIESLMAAHRDLPRPDRVGHTIGINHKK